MTGHFPARYAIDGHFAWVPSNAKRGMPDWLSLDAPSLPEMLGELPEKYDGSVEFDEDKYETNVCICSRERLLQCDGRVGQSSK